MQYICKACCYLHYLQHQKCTPPGRDEKPRSEERGRGGSDFLRLLKTRTVLEFLELRMGLHYKPSLLVVGSPFLSLPSLLCFSLSMPVAVEIQGLVPLKLDVAFLPWHLLVKHQSAMCFLLLIHSCNKMQENRGKHYQRPFFSENSAMIAVSFAHCFCFFGGVIIFLP